MIKVIIKRRQRIMKRGKKPSMAGESRYTSVGRGFDRKILPRRIHSQIISCRKEGDDQTVDYERQLLSSSLTTLR